MRLDRYLSKALGISRREAKRLVKSGRVKIGDKNKIAKDFSIKIDDEQVFVNDKPIEKPKEKIYIMLNKPAGFVSSTKDINPTVLDLIDHPRVAELFPVGRLDMDAKGLLILTNDGQFAHRIISPKYHVEREYEVRVSGSAENALKLTEGVKVGQHFFKAKKVEINRDVVRIVICEGKHHQVKLMMKAVGLGVVELKRVRIGPLTLDIDEGEWRELTESEVRRLMGA